MILHYNTPSVQMLYELRDSPPPEGIVRRVSARLFFFHSRPGLCDASGVLWPIQLPKQNLAAGYQQAMLVCDGVWSDGHFCVCEIKHLSSQKESEWYQTHIPNPIPDCSWLEHYWKEVPLSSETRFFTTPTTNRWRILREKARFEQRIHQYFTNRGFVSVAVPYLVPSGSMERYLEPFQTEYVGHDGQKTLYELPTSPELALKKLCTEGIWGLYHLGKAFRNHGEQGVLHQPEFGLLEWYQASSSLQLMMEETQHLVYCLATSVGLQHFPKKWEMFTVNGLFKKLLDIDLEQVQKTDDFMAVAKPHSGSIAHTDTWDVVFSKLFMEKIEPFLKKYTACFVHEYPIQQTTLARRVPNDRPFMRRFEGYVQGIEICNGYEELIDAEEFRVRVSQTQKVRDIPCKMDPSFEHAMEFGLPPLCCGNALGVDRLISLLLDCPSIADVVALPF